MMRYFSLVFLLICSGCGQYNIRNIDKPPPHLHEVWKKQDASYLQIRKALLECGQGSLGGTSREIYEKIGIVEQKDQYNHDFLVDRCMINAGFVEQNTSWTLKDACADSRYSSYPACQPNAVIPIPSVERRLNSWYCKTKTDYVYCLEHALSPQLCSPEKTSNPPQECLSDDQSSTSPTSSQNPPKINNYRPPDRIHQQAIQLQRDTQKQSNRQMNKMLKSTRPNIKR